MSGSLDIGRNADGEFYINGGTDGTLIGNTGDRLKAEAQLSESSASIGSVSLTDGPNLDAFGRLRVSNVYSLFEFSHRFDKEPLKFYESTATGGTSTHSANDASVQMTVTSSSGSSVIRQSRVHFPYHPGKSQLVVLTGNMGTARTNCTKRIGAFSDQDGLFFQQEGSTLSVVQRSSTSGSPVNTVVAQSSWNLDKLDGTGSSGYTINFSNQNIFLIDYQWLGSGRVRFGMVLDGQIIYCHEFLNANALTTVYIKTGSLPIRYEITNTGATAGSTTMQATCGSLISEGGFDPLGNIRSVNNQVTLKTIQTASQTPLVALRLGGSYQRAALQLLDVSIFCQSVDDLIFEIYFNPTLTGASWSATGIAEVDFSSTSFTGGTLLHTGYIRGASSSPSVVSIENALTKVSTYFLGANNFTNTSDILMISCRSFGTVANVTGSITFREVT